MIMVAVYGTLMKGECNERWREGIDTDCTGYMTGKLYDTGFGFPAFEPGYEGKVKCELLRVNEEQLAHMDVLEGYPHLYRREKVDVLVENTYIEAVVYVMNCLPTKAKEISGGDWPKYRKICYNMR